MQKKPTNQHFRHKILQIFVDEILQTFWSGQRFELSYDDLEDFQTRNMMKDPISNNWICSICGKTGVNKIDISRHIESNHAILPPLVCQFCNKFYKSKKSLRQHQVATHENPTN